MSRKENSLDNAVIENFFGSLKSELLKDGKLNGDVIDGILSREKRR